MHVDAKVKVKAYSIK